MIVIITFLTFTYAQSIWNIFGSDDLVSEDLAEDGIEKEQVISLDEQQISRIAFGSCYGGTASHENQQIWDVILSKNPELYIWLGDAIYADIHIDGGEFEINDLKVWRQKYLDLKSEKHYAALRDQIPIIGVWDDHDFGLNNAVIDFPYKKESQQMLLEFIDEPIGSPRWKQEGVYASYQYKDVNIILLDNRYFNNHENDMLGQTQWTWLENELRRDTRITIIWSGVQISTLDKKNIEENWDDTSYQRLMDLIEDKPNIVLISGDVHYAEVFKLCTDKHAVYEITSSGLTHDYSDEVRWTAISKYAMTLPRYHNVGSRIIDINFGMVEINWESQTITMLLYGTNGEELLRHQYGFDEKANNNEW